MISLVFALALQCPDGSPPPCATTRTARGPAAPSVAVLYFDNLSRDSGDAYLADGLTEQTIAQLGEIGRLTVSSRYAVRRFKGGASTLDPSGVGRALNVTYLVTGSVQRAGTRLRVGVELLRAGTGVRVWGEQYDRTETDLLRLQDDIASAVATGIVGRLLPNERTALSNRSTRNPAAYDLFLRGNFHLARRTPESLLHAIRAYQAAIAADPAYTDALARIAYAYGIALDGEWDVGIPRDSLVARGLAMANRAVRLDSTSSDAALAQAYLRMAASPLTFEGAREGFERAIRLNPRSAEAHHQYASYLKYMGDTAAARMRNIRALQLEPGRAITWFQLAELEGYGRSPTVALRYIDSALAADQGFALAETQRFTAALALGDTAMARRAARSLMATPNLAIAGMVFDMFLTTGALGDAASVRRFEAIMASAPASPTQPGTVLLSGYGASLLARLGDRESALRYLEAARPRGIRLHDIMRQADFDPIRGDPRFVAVFNETMPPGSSW